METPPKGQKLIKIDDKDHYFYDKQSMVIYWVRKNLDELEKISSGVKYDLSTDKTAKSSLIKASRIIPIKLKEKKEQEKKKKSANTKLMGEFIDDMTNNKSHFHTSKKAPVTADTLESYRTSANHLRDFFEGYLPSELTPDPKEFEAAGLEYKEPWLEFVRAFQEKNPGFNMFNVTKHFRSLCKYMHENGVIQKRPNIYNPFAKKEEIKRKKKRYRPYEPGEILQMDAVCNDDQRLALWLGYNEAFRLDDCVSLDWPRVHLGPSAYVEFHGDENKTGFTGKVPLSDTSAELLRERRKSKVSQWVFAQKLDPSLPMLSQALKFEEVVRNSGVLYGSHHILRHTRLTEDFGNPQLPDTLVMKMRRVSLAVAVEHYIHASLDDIEKFRNTGRAKRGAR